jgi:hypothetical protein
MDSLDGFTRYTKLTTRGLATAIGVRLQKRRRSSRPPRFEKSWRSTWVPEAFAPSQSSHRAMNYGLALRRNQLGQNLELQHFGFDAFFLLLHLRLEHE